MPFATDSLGRNQVAQARTELAELEMQDMLRAGKYRAAIPKLTAFLAVDGSSKDLLYHRAFCYSRVGNMQLAVNDCKAAVELGSKEAASLYNKINPLRRRVAYTITRCCDGSSSSATGRGACSHHGGVCNWNDPVYEEYRQYE